MLLVAHNNSAADNGAWISFQHSAMIFISAVHCFYMITIRKAGLKDMPKIMDMWKEFRDSLHETNSKEPRLEKYTLINSKARATWEKIFSGKIRSGRGRVHIAEADGKAVGYSLIFIIKKKPYYMIREMGYVADLYVRKEFRGRGISSMFRDEAIKWFKSKGLKHVSIDTSFMNTHAHGIYERWGFLDYTREMRMEI